MKGTNHNMSTSEISVPPVPRPEPHVRGRHRPEHVGSDTVDVATLLSQYGNKKAEAKR